MFWLDGLAWVSSVAIVIMYSISVTKKNPIVLHVANFLGGLVLAADNAHLHAWPAFSLNIAFVLVGAIGVGTYLLVRKSIIIRLSNDS